MIQLTIIKHGNIDAVDSREVAAMTEKRHDHLMRDIAGYVQIMESSTKSKIGLSEAAAGNSSLGDSAAPKFGVSDFFIPSTYTDVTGRTLPCYLLTKKGCDMVANKMTGQKGVLFTAAYITAFEAMREHIETGKPLPKMRKTERPQRLGEVNAAARIIRQTLKEAGMAPQYVAVAMKSLYAPVGVEIPLIGVTTDKRTYDATTIAKRLGILSKTGNPHGQAVSAIIAQLDIWEAEKELVPYQNCVSGHSGANMQYTESVIAKVSLWLDRNGYPLEIQHGDKGYKVLYQKKPV